MEIALRDRLVILMVSFGIFGIVVAKKYVSELNSADAKALHDSLVEGRLPTMKLAGPTGPNPLIA